MFQLSQQGAVNVLEGQGPLNEAAATGVRELLDQCVAHGQPRIVVSLHEVPLIDSAGLEVLLDVRDACLRRGGTLAVASPNSLCRDILHVTGLDQQLDLHDDVLSAIGSFAG